MTTQTTAPADAAPASLALAYGPRDTDQACRTCGAIIPADPRPDFGYESEDDEQPVCAASTRRDTAPCKSCVWSPKPSATHPTPTPPAPSSGPSAKASSY